MIKKEIEKFAKEIGFDLVGFASPKLPGEYFEVYEKWLNEGMNADMEYMKKSSPRADLEEVLPGVKTVIVVGINYFQEQYTLEKNCGRVARYAYGRDYHKILGKKLKELGRFIQEKFSKEETKSYVDTGPILEKAYAREAGLGVIGKNSCLITKEFGTWIFLGIILTTAKIAPTKTAVHKPFSLCGSCRRCLDACPTKAIISPGMIDARRCISYHTIENKEKIPAEIKTAIKKTQRIFGCDICQEVCPHNSRAQTTIHQEFLVPKIAGDSLDLKKILSIKSDDQFLKTFAGSPLMRAKRKALQRNAGLYL